MRLQIARAPSSDQLAAATMPPRRPGASACWLGDPEPSGVGSVHAGDQLAEFRGCEAPVALDPKMGDPIGPKIRGLPFAGGNFMGDPAEDSP